MLAVLAVIAAIAGAIFSGPTFIRPKYKSTMIVFPLNIFPTSIESETEQSQQLFLSSSIKDAVIEKFDLWEHWRISKEDPKAAYWMDLEYQTNISISRTQYESVVVEVMDYSPDTAKLIADEILVKYNDIAKKQFQSKGQEYLDAANVSLIMRTKYIDSLQHRLEELSTEHGLLAYEFQAKEVTKSYYEMLRNGSSTAKMDEIKQMLDNLEKYGPEFQKISILMKEYMIFYAEWTDKRDNYYFETQSQFRFYNLIEEPKVAVKKSYPVRWLILASSVLGTLFLSMILLAQFDRPKP